MKMILHNKCFPVKFAKFLRVLILSKNSCEGRFCRIYRLITHVHGEATQQMSEINTFTKLNVNVRPPIVVTNIYLTVVKYLF